MTPFEEEHHQITARHFAVLDALTERVNQSTATPNLDTRHLPDSAGYRYKRGVNFDDRERYKDGTLSIGIDDEDDDWRDIRACGDDPDLPSDPFHHFHNPQTHTVYYIERKSHQNAGSTAAPTRDISSSVEASSAEARASIFEDPDTYNVVSRLRFMDGQFGPPGYSSWLSKQIQNRHDLDSGIPGFACLCDMCRTMLTYSLSMFKEQFNDRSGRTGPVYRTHHSIEIFAHHGTIKALWASAHAGCHLCSLMLGPDVREQDENYSKAYFLYLFGVSVGLRLRDHSFYTMVWLDWKEESAEVSSTLKHNATDALEVHDLARSWLSRCLEEDSEFCSIATKFLPSRLVQIATENGVLHSAHLVLGSSLPPETQYLTLSHCWGDDKARPISLTQETLGNFRNDIPLSTLSKTFRETLQVTSWLGYRHVWIDSLCILQDSSQDWMHEAARMGDIYRHSTCTIAAVGARDGNDGLFFRRYPLALTRCPLFAGRGKQMSTRSTDAWPSPLSNRAWAVQERYLSSRTLSFGSDMISWACRRTEACEGPHAHDIQMQNHSFPKLLDGRTEGRMVERSWKNIVRQYSTCQLTYWKDKWPAFQGLTTEVEKAQGWTIVHGLRTHLLGKDLLWHAIKPKTGRETIECGEPSWSWLNVESQVYWSSPNLRLDANIVLQKLSVPSDAIISSQHPAEHVIQIEACTADFKPSSSRGRFGDLKCTLTVKNPKYETQTSKQSAPEPDRLLHCSWDPDTVPFHRGDLRALQIASRWKRTKGSKRWHYRSRGLVITAVLDMPGYWRRVGMYAVDDWHDPTEQASDSKHSDEQSNPDVAAARELLSGDEAALRGLPCPWNREKTTIFLI